MAIRAALFGTGIVTCLARDASAVTPIQKVLTMMEEMKAKGIAEKEEEATKFSAFGQWCTNQQRIKTDEINASNDKIEQLKATIQKEAVNIKKLTARIEELDEDVGRWVQDKASSMDVRNRENADFKSTVADYQETIDALNGAIATLKKQAADVPQAAVLLQVQRLKLLPDDAKSALAEFLQNQDPDFLHRAAPQANAYEFQSGGIVDMLEKLKDEFDTKRTDLVAEERENQHAFDLLYKQLTDNVDNAEHEISKRNELRQQSKEAKAAAEGDLAQTTIDRDEDQKYFDETVALCQQKSNDFAARQQLRAEEIEAISKAIEIIGSKKVAGAGEAHLPKMFLQKSPILAHLRTHDDNPFQVQAIAFLTDKARTSGSRVLAVAAEEAAANPFGKVKKLIKDLISKLMQEATAETEAKGFCDAELAKNKIAREARTADVNALTTEIEGLTADIASLTQDIADLATAVQELDQAMSDATEDRLAAKAKNAQTVKEAKEAQVAVEAATAVMKDFYAKAAEATALVQQSPADDAPETFDKPYTGMAGAGGNIVDFLEVILTDFERLESETTAQEEAEAEEYKQFMFESKKDKALKENESKLKGNTKTDKEGALHSAQGELESNQAQLDKATEYYEKLKPTCVDSGITYEERVKQREAEIQSLTEALKILQGQDLPTLR